MKEEFPFVTGDGDAAFTVKAGGILDVAGNYSVIDDATGEAVVSLDEDLSLFVENWTVRDPETGTRWRPSSPRANCSRCSGTSSTSRTSSRTSTRYATPAGPRRRHRRQVFLRDTYTVTIDDASNVPKEAVVAAACVIDALENQ